MCGFSDFTLGLYEKALPASLSWAERFEQVQRAGYGYMEFSIDDSDERQARLDWSAAERREFRRQVEISGLRVPTMALSGHHRYPIGSACAAVQAQGMAIMEKAINLASELGIGIVQIAGYDELEGQPSTEQTAADFALNLEKSIRLAARLGVVLALENMGVPFMDSIKKVMNFVNRFKTPYLQAYADIGNSTATGQGVAADIASASGHLVAMHIKDTIPGVIRHIPFGKGTVDFQTCFTAIKNAGFTGMFLLEMWAGDYEDPFAEAIDARVFVEKHMKQVWHA